MEIRSLNVKDLVQLHRAFNLAFTDYNVTINTTLAEFEYRINKKLLIDYDISAATFDGPELLGFILHTSNNYEGLLTAYNGGTGVIPGFRNQDLAEEIYQFLIPKIRDHSISRILLEVVENNEKAIRLYEKLGFMYRRSFVCFKQVKPLKLTQMQKVEAGTFKDIDTINNDFEPSFGDTESQLAKGDERVIVAKKDDRIVGHLIFQPQNGRISQIAVSRVFRSERFGESLIYAAQQITNKSLTVMNIPSNEIGMRKFLQKCGFENQVNQFEMELIL